MTRRTTTRVASLSRVGAELRRAIAEGPRDRGAHARWMAELPCFREIAVAPPPRPRAAEAPARVVAWNAERGRNTADLAAVLRAEAPQLVLLTELDLGMARSGNVDTARALAAELGMGFAYAVEFLELGLGGPDERAACGDEENEDGFHGGAILSAAPLEDPVLVRLEEDGAWLADPERGEPRVGGRMALVATWRLAGVPVTVASVHLESHSSCALRRDQIAALLDALERYAPGAPTLIGGDLNTFSLGYADTRDGERLRTLLTEDARRFVHPVPYEPLFGEAAARGFRWEPWNEMGTPTVRVPEPAPSARGGLKIDWLLGRGLRPSDPRVLEARHPVTGAALSDHEPIAVTVRPGAE